MFGHSNMKLNLVGYASMTSEPELLARLIKLKGPEQIENCARVETLQGKVEISGLSALLMMSQGFRNARDIHQFKACLDIVLKSGANTQVKDSKGCNVLHHILPQKRKDLVLLILNKINCDDLYVTKDFEGYSPR